MLFEPLEKQFCLLATFAEGSDIKLWKHCLIGKKRQRFNSFWILETNVSQMFGIILTGLDSILRDALIADDTAAPALECCVGPMGILVRHGTSDEESAGLVQGMHLHRYFGKMKCCSAER